MLGRRTCRDMRGYAGICGTDHLPEIGPAGLPFLTRTPPNQQRSGNRTANDQQAEKRIAIFDLTYWLSII